MKTGPYSFWVVTALVAVSVLCTSCGASSGGSAALTDSDGFRAETDSTQASMPRLEFAILADRYALEELVPGTALDASEYTVFMTGDHVRSVQWVEDTAASDLQLWLELDPDGTETLAEYTSQHLGEMMLLIVDGVVISAPVVHSTILDGAAAISVGQDQELRAELESAMVRSN